MTKIELVYKLAGAQEPVHIEIVGRWYDIQGVIAVLMMSGAVKESFKS